MGLQHAFYIIGIIYMGVMLLLALAILVAVFVIKSKVNRVHRMVDEKINRAMHVGDRLATILRAVRYFLKG